jgi:hypothetical protein
MLMVFCVYTFIIKNNKNVNEFYTHDKIFSMSTLHLAIILFIVKKTKQLMYELCVTFDFSKIGVTYVWEMS